MKLAYVALLACGFATAAVADDITSAFSKCAVTKDDRLRLACYDKIRDDVVKANSGTQAPSGGYLDIQLIDLKVDLKKLTGKKVSVSALVQVMGDMAFLKSDDLDMSPVGIDTENLPRDDRKKLASGCQMVLCKGQFFGTVKQLPLGLGVSVDRVAWK